MDIPDDTLSALRVMRFGPEALSCHVDEFRALKYLGQRGKELTDELATRFEGAVARCERVARPRGIARSFAIDRERPDGIALAGSSLVLTGATSPATSMAAPLPACLR